MPEKHALLSASSAERWLNCPPSARICAEKPDTESPYAKEGTLAHAICEVKLYGFFSAAPKKTITSKLNKLKKDKLYQPEMDGYTDDYTDYVKKIALSFSSKAHAAVERRVDYSNYAPEGFGTADCIIVHGEELHIIDFKYGKGVPVSAENNSQLKLYALGAYQQYGLFYPIKNITLHIVQPRINNFSEWATTLEELTKWGDSIKPAAQLAFEGGGEFHSGEHCRFCKINGTCRKRCEECLSAEQDFGYRRPPELTDEEVGKVLEHSRFLKKWAEDIEKYALSAILDGKKIEGWKAVEGRGSRQYTDTEKIPQRLEAAGYSSEMAFKREMLTPPQLEKVIGKKDFTEIFADLVEAVKGKPTLAHISDSRPEYIKGTSAQEDFK